MISANMTDNHNRDILMSLALENIPRLLGLVDRNPFSRTYGCFDREYWHYRTHDFPCGMSQEFVLPLALAYKADHPMNRWKGNQRVRELAEAGINFAMESSHKDGTCDDYYPWERALGALVFSTYAATEAYKVLNLDDERMADFFRKRCEYIIKHNETGRLSNHQALAALTLYNTYLLTGDDKFKRASEERIELTLSWQHKEEGWFQEYEGADPGYQTCSIDFLSKYYVKSGNSSVIEPLKKAVNFCTNFMHPDGSYGGEYGSRNTYHYYPHGFEIMARFTPEASYLNDMWLDGVRRGKRYFNDDDRMLGHLTYNYIQAWSDYCAKRKKAPAELKRERIVLFRDAGIVSVKKKRYSAVVALNKGGVFKVFNSDGCIKSDTGLFAKTKNGKVLVSHIIDPENRIDADVDNGVFTVSGVLMKRSGKLATPVKQIIFRMINITVGRFTPNLLRFLLQQILITGKNRTPYSFRRTIKFSENEISVEDELPAGCGLRGLASGPDGTSIYIAASNVYQESVLAHSWEYAPGSIAENGGIWKRVIKMDNKR